MWNCSDANLQDCPIFIAKGTNWFVFLHSRHVYCICLFETSAKYLKNRWTDFNETQRKESPAARLQMKIVPKLSNFIKQQIHFNSSSFTDISIQFVILCKKLNEIKTPPALRKTNKTHIYVNPGTVIDNYQRVLWMLITSQVLKCF